MKKLLYVAALLLAVVGIVIGAVKFWPNADPEGSEEIALHLIRNADGSYGGSYNVAEYGWGAPLNGAYDVKTTDYYTVNNDYYNMSSTSERTIVPHFASYQQTMADTSGIACLMMLLNYVGEDVYSTYTELALVQRYEALMGETIYGNGTTEEGLMQLIADLGLGWDADNTSIDIESASDKFAETKKVFLDALAEGKFVFVRYQSPVGYSWKVVIGYDTLGGVTSPVSQKTSQPLSDDVVIFAEPYDGADHFQDGYATERAKDFTVWWQYMTINGRITDTYSYVVVDPKIDIEYDLQPVDQSVKQTLYDIHLPLNPDGSYGGTRDKALYGSIGPMNGSYNHTNSNYYKISDFYNMDGNATRVMLPGYTVLQQTMSSSCGICAVTSVLNYYGETDASLYDLELSYLEDCERVIKKTVTGRGTTAKENADTLADLGYETECSYTRRSSGATPKYDTYEKYMFYIRKNLVACRPVVVATNLGSGHFVTIIGIDDMGTDYIYDDVVILADSADYWDGYQDGYNVISAYKFFTQHTETGHSTLQSLLVIYPKEK